MCKNIKVIKTIAHPTIPGVQWEAGQILLYPDDAIKSYLMDNEAGECTNKCQCGDEQTMVSAEAERWVSPTESKQLSKKK